MSAPSVIEQRVIFHLDDPERSFVRVGLDIDDALEGPRRFRRTATGWTLALPRPRVARIEYRLVLTARDGSTGVVCDPGNPERVRTAFGERSVASMPGYERPDWLLHAAPAGRRTAVAFRTKRLGRLPISVWAPGGLDPTAPAHLLVVNDGPEYVDLAALDQYAAAMIEHGTLPEFRMMLMQPVKRDEWYAANPDYIEASLTAVRKVMGIYPTLGPVSFMGASLGGLCALLTALAAGDTVGTRAVFAQSGSFFQPRTDPQESAHPYFERVVAAVQDVVQSALTSAPLVVGMTCGQQEENLGNNRAMAEALAAQGHQVALSEVPDLHNYTAWRDSLHPTLTEVLRAAWGARG